MENDLDIKDNFGGHFETLAGEIVERPVNFYVIGRFLYGLELTREMLGHVNIASTLPYIQGESRNFAEFQFLEHIINRERGIGKNRRATGTASTLTKAAE